MTEPRAVLEPGSDRLAGPALWTAVTAGCALLVLRPALIGRAWTPDALFTCYVFLGMVAVSAPVAGRTRRFLGPIAVTVIGVAAIVLSSSVTGPAFPLPRTAEILALNAGAAVS